MAKQLNVGDRVRLTGAFLRSTGQIVGREGTKRWNVLGLGWGGQVAIVDEEAITDYYTAEEMAADPSLKWRRINVANLERVK